jgi:hypothetical protein
LLPAVFTSHPWSIRIQNRGNHKRYTGNPAEFGCKQGQKGRGFNMHDPLAVSALLDPNILTFEDTASR